MNALDKSKPGRKPLPPEDRTQSITFYIPVKLLDQLKAIADKKSGELGFVVNRSQILVHAINNYVKANS